MAVLVPFWLYVSYRLVCRFNRLEAKARAPLELEVAKHTAALQQVTEANNAKNVFMAALSHELRTPLSGISGAVQLLQETGLDARQREYARMIAYANATLLEVLDDMLTFARLEAGKSNVEVLPFNVRAVIDDMLSLQTIQAQARGVALIRDIDAGVPEVIVGDRRKLNQVLLNIIGNAIKFTDEGSVTIAVNSTLLPEARVRLAFSVTDTGIGIPAEQCAEVLKPFAQVEDAARGRRGGTGLGLAICQRLLLNMGGCLHLESKLNEGTCVSFYLDVEIAPELPVLAGEDAATHQGRLRPLTVLLVEDDEVNRLVCTRYLALKGHHPLVAGDGRQVMHIMQARQRAVDAVVMDLNLPGMSGIDLARQLREIEGGRWKNLPVIMMSADVSGDAIERCLVAGMSAFLRKPFTSVQLNAALHSVIVGQGRDIVPEPLQAVRMSADVVEAGSVLDRPWITAEIDELGTGMLLELLNIFRAGVATSLGKINLAAAHRNWPAVAAEAHRLQGAAGNLGMIRVMDATRALQQLMLAAQVDAPAAVHVLGELESLCQNSCDELRLMLLASGDQGVAFAAHSDK